MPPPLSLLLGPLLGPSGPLPPHVLPWPALTLLEEHLVAAQIPVITGIRVILPTEVTGARYGLVHFSVPVADPPGLEPYRLPVSLEKLASLVLLLDGSGGDLLPLTLAVALSSSLPPIQLTVRPDVVRLAVGWLIANSRHFAEAAFDGESMAEIEELAGRGAGCVLGHLLRLQHGAARGEGALGVGGDELMVMPAVDELVPPLGMCSFVCVCVCEFNYNSVYVVWSSRTLPPVTVDCVPMVQPSHPVVPLARMLRLHGRLAASDFEASICDPMERVSREHGFLLRAFPWLFSAGEHAAECPLHGPRLQERPVLGQLVEMLDMNGRKFGMLT